jgi:hypothetical protein
MKYILFLKSILLVIATLFCHKQSKFEINLFILIDLHVSVGNENDFIKKIIKKSML